MAVDSIKLQELAQLFKPYATLYAVGGCVRDNLLGCECSDIDVCSVLEVNTVKNILSNSDFVVLDKNLRMGTVYISADNFKVEYTTFRTDSYERASGAHSPTEVKFTRDISIDARRRDFKCNALYLDIVSGNIIDPLGGLNDINNRVLSTADEPNEVFEADGLRVLRLVRFASELGFEIEAETMRVAKLNAWRVKDIVAERIRDELCKIFIADCAHLELGLDAAHLRGLRLLDELGLIDLLLPELAQLKGVAQNKKYHLYDVYVHTVKAYEISPPHLRIAALLHDLGKPKALQINDGKNMHGHDAIGAQLATDILSRLKFSNAERNRIVKIVRLHMTDLKGDMSHAKLRRFAAENADIMEDLCDFREIDCVASNGSLPERNSLREVWEEVTNDGTPLSIKQLKVDGNDLIAHGVKEKEIGVLLKALWEDTVLNPTLNDRDKALAYLDKQIAKFHNDKM